jgi:hypothetical protein
MTQLDVENIALVGFDGSVYRTLSDLDLASFLVEGFCEGEIGSKRNLVK